MNKKLNDLCKMFIYCVYIYTLNHKFNWKLSLFITCMMNLATVQGSLKKLARANWNTENWFLYKNF